MHEISLLENVREILEDHALSQNFSKVNKITLEIGQLSCVEVDALRFGFDVVMKGTLAEGAELVLTEQQGQGICKKCHQTIPLENLYDPCLLCGNPFVDVSQGNSLKIKDLNVI